MIYSNFEYVTGSNPSLHQSWHDVIVSGKVKPIKWTMKVDYHSPSEERDKLR
jgi:hypothetical protein